MFDRYVAVDWSANASRKTGADSIWIADGRSGELAVTLANPPTRADAAQMLNKIVERGIEANERVLIGVDATLGFPAGSAAIFGLSGATPWRAMWTRLESAIVDDDRNTNNRFDVAAELNRRARDRGVVEGPFWGVPRSRTFDGLSPTKPHHADPSIVPPEYRLVEQVYSYRGRRPKSVWQLLGAGSVGSQTITLIPWLERLRRESNDRIDVWPFTTGLAAPRRPIVIAEVWPTMFGDGFEDVRGRHRPLLDDGVAVLDAVQVVAVVDAFRTADEDGTLGEWFRPALGERARSEDAGAALRLVVEEEGWMLTPPLPEGPGRPYRRPENATGTVGNMADQTTPVNIGTGTDDSRNTLDLGAIVADLNRLLRIRTTPIGIKRFATETEMAAVPKLRRPSSIHTFDQIVGQASRLGWTVGITAADLVGDQCAAVVGLHPRDDAWLSGERYAGVWYSTPEDAAAHQAAMITPTFGEYEAIVASPLAANRIGVPEVCLIYATPAQMILFINGLQWSGYAKLEWGCVGESSCADSWGRALATGEPSLSIPCFAERRYGGVMEDELLMAIPPKFLPGVINGLDALARNGLRYPVPPYGIQSDARAGLGASYG